MRPPGPKRSVMYARHACRYYPPACLNRRPVRQRGNHIMSKSEKFYQRCSEKGCGHLCTLALDILRPDMKTQKRLKYCHEHILKYVLEEGYAVGGYDPPEILAQARKYHDKYYLSGAVLEMMNERRATAQAADRTTTPVRHPRRFSKADRIAGRGMGIVL
jgi:hypothetical protein